MVDPVSLIQATLAPMFLVTGVGVYLGVVQNRLFRVIDRLRVHGKEAERSVGGNTAEQREERRLLLVRRGKLLRNAIFFGMLTIALTALSAIFLLIPALLDAPSVREAAVAVFSLALTSLAASVLMAVQDTFLSVRAVEREALSGSH